MSDRIDSEIMGWHERRTEAKRIREALVLLDRAHITVSFSSSSTPLRDKHEYAVQQHESGYSNVRDAMVAYLQKQLEIALGAESAHLRRILEYIESHNKSGEQDNDGD